MYSCPRAATVQCAGKALVWALDRVTFRHMMVHANEEDFQDTLAALSSVTLLKSLTGEQLQKVAEAVRTVRFRRGETIIRKGEPGDCFYIIKSGAVVCTGLGAPGRELNDVHLPAGASVRVRGARAVAAHRPPQARTLASVRSCARSRGLPT